MFRDLVQQSAFVYEFVLQGCPVFEISYKTGL